jgi:hypothetical protein
MEFRSFPEAIESIMEQRGWSQARLAREWKRHQTWVGKVIRGERDTPIGQATRLLASVGYEVVIRPKWEKSDPVKRREFHDKIIKLAGGAAAASVAGVTFVPSAKVPVFRNHEYVMALVDHIKSTRHEQGGAQLISTVRGYVDRIDIAAVMRGMDRRLKVAAARLVNVYAETLYDADRLNHAEGVAKSGLALAQASEYAEVQALMYATLSQVATHAGAGDRGRDYALAGLRIPEVSDALRAELLKRKMRSLAVLPSQQRAVLDTYESIHKLDQGSADSFKVESFTGLNLNLGVALSDLGRHQAAIHAFSESARHYAKSSPHYHADSLHGEVKSMLQARMPEVAADRMLLLAHVLPLVNSAREQRKAREIVDSAAAWVKVPAVREARDQLREVIRPATTRA